MWTGLELDLVHRTMVALLRACPIPAGVQREPRGTARQSVAMIVRDADPWPDPIGAIAESKDLGFAPGADDVSVAGTRWFTLYASPFAVGNFGGRLMLWAPRQCLDQLQPRPLEQAAFAGDVRPSLASSGRLALRDSHTGRVQVSIRTSPPRRRQAPSDRRTAPIAAGVHHSDRAVSTCRARHLASGWGTVRDGRRGWIGRRWTLTRGTRRLQTAIESLIGLSVKVRHWFSCQGCSGMA